MMESPRGLRLIVLSAIVLCIVASLTGARAVQGNGSGMKFATLNQGRVLSEAKTAIAVNAELKKKQDAFTFYGRTVQSNPLLEDKEQRELATLVQAEANTAAGGLTDPQKARKKQLLEKSKNLNDDYSGLQTKAVGALNQQERDRVNLYAKSVNESDGRLTAEKTRGEEEIKKMLEDWTAKMSKDMKDALAKVAKEKGITLVFDSNTVLYADIDLTDDILKQLNK